jgi:hypothetical protein
MQEVGAPRQRPEAGHEGLEDPSHEEVESTITSQPLFSAP